jgi:hypothetical protein
MKDKKSPFNYNAALIDAVTSAYGSDSLVTPDALKGLAGGLYSGIRTIAQASREAKDELMKREVSTKADTSQFTAGEINNLITLKNQYADITNKLAKPFVSRQKKQELNAELNAINSRTANYIRSVNHIMDLQEKGIENDDMRKGVYNKQENMLWDQIVTGNARTMAAENFDATTGKTYFANPNGNVENPIDVLSWKPMKTINGEWISNDTKLFNNIRSYAKDEDTPKELIQEQIRNVVSANYYSDPEAIFDSAGIDQFVDSLYGSEEFDAVLAKKFPSEYEEMMQDEKEGNIDLAKSQYKQLMRKVNLDEQWINFRTNAAMNQYDSIKSQIKENTPTSVEGKDEETPQQTYRIATYNKQGTYTATKTYTEDQLRKMFDKAKEPNTEEEFTLGKFTVKVRSNAKGNRIWQVYSIDGETPVGKGVYYSLAEALKNIATIETFEENNEYSE